jgi:ABC-2 type transport system permease protein
MALGFIVAGFPAAGSFVAGLATALCSCSFAAMAAIAAQTAPNARLARGLSFGAMAFFFGWQMIANAVGNSKLLLWTPFGWCAYARPYAGENFSLFAFAILVIALLTIIAYILSDHRDLGGSYLRERSGRIYASKSFKNAFSLAWRLQRGMFFVWVAAYAVMGLIIASLVPSINKMLAGTSFLPELSTVLGGAGNAFLAILAYILTQVLTAYAIMAVLRIREEESLTRTELVLSSSVSRTRYMAGHLFIAFAGSAAAIALFGFCIGNFAACIQRLPAVWLIASVTVFLYGLVPRAAAPVGWGLFGLLLLLEFLWEIRAIGANVFALSPFAWVYPGVTVSLPSIFTMLFLAVILVGSGLVCFSHRDIISE